MQPQRVLRRSTWHEDHLDTPARGSRAGGHPDDRGAGEPLCRAANDVDFDRQRMRLVVPRGCLGSPTRLRLNLVTANDYPGTPVDHAPRKRGFGPWVRTG